MENQKHFDYVFATPGASLKSEYVESLLTTIKHLDAWGKTWTFLNKFSSFVPSAREMTATGTNGHDWSVTALGGGAFTYGKVIWIDSDITWDIPAFERLISWNYDIVSGVCPISDQRIAATRWDAEGYATVLGPYEFIMEDRPIQVDGVGFGFLAVKSGVFEKMQRPWFKIREGKVSGVDFPVNMGEDYSWCVGAKEAGFDIWLDPLCRVGHVKEYILR